MAVAGFPHLGGVGVKDSLVVGAGVLSEDLVELCAGLIAVGGAGFLGHLDAAVGHESPLQGLVGLDAHDLLQILQVLINVAGAVRGQAADHVGLHVQNAALGALFLLQLLQGVPELVGGVGRTCQEALVPVVRSVVLLDEVTDVDFFFPNAALKAFPLGIILHSLPPVSMRIKKVRIN